MDLMLVISNFFLFGFSNLTVWNMFEQTVLNINLTLDSDEWVYASAQQLWLRWDHQVWSSQSHDYTQKKTWNNRLRYFWILLRLYQNKVSCFFEMLSTDFVDNIVHKMDKGGPN